MSHEHETPTGSASTSDPPAEPCPEFLARARRVLSGDRRPDDYLAVTPEARARADFDIAYVRSHLKIEPLPEVVANQLREWVMSFHHGGQNIAYVEDEKGVIVVAAGLDQITVLFQNLRDEWIDQLNDGCPEPF